MHFDVSKRTIFRVRSGSHAYGTNTENSDVDIKGVCIEPMSHQLGFLYSFEQYECYANKGAEFDQVIYSLKKFAKLAADCNPNIIEVLHVDDSDILMMDEFGEELRSHRNDFLSTKARWTFSGYMMAQVKRIKAHRKWLLDPPKNPPCRSDFGLPAAGANKSELGAFDSLFNLKTIDDEAMSPERFEELVSSAKDILGVELPKDVITLFTREKAFRAAKTHWDQYVNWKNTRNPKRAELESKVGYDSKHAYHVIRLGRMCSEILESGNVIVKRPDRDELLEIRNGAWSYERLLEEAEKLDKQAEELYKTSSLPKEPNRFFLNELIVDMSLRYHKKYSG